MKDGIYRITLKIDGQDVVAEAQVRNGIFQGLGDLAGIVGVFATERLPQATVLPLADRGDVAISRGRKRQDPLAGPAVSPWLEIDANEFASESRFAALATDLRRVREEVGAIQRKARHHVTRGAARLAVGARAGLWTFGDWDEWDDEGPLRMT